MQLKSTADAIPVPVGGILERDQGRVVHRVQESKAGHGRRSEFRHTRGARGKGFGGITGDGPLLQLWATELAHEVESRRTGPPESGEVEHRVSLSIADVALLAGRCDEHGAEPVGNGEATGELLVAYQVLPDLGGAQPFDGPGEALYLRGPGGGKEVAPAERDEHENRQDGLSRHVSDI